MKSFDRIVVATDFSSCSDAAAAVAAQLARQLDVTILVVHVIDTSGIMDGYGDTQFRTDRLHEVRRAAHDRTARFAARHLGTLDNVHVHVADGRDVATAILDAANQLGADMIVLGTHGTTGLAHMILGSVAERVVRASVIPVLTVREADAQVGGVHPGPVT